jgi:hypothetical protein
MFGFKRRAQEQRKQEYLEALKRAEDLLNQKKGLTSTDEILTSTGDLGAKILENKGGHDDLIYKNTVRNIPLQKQVFENRADFYDRLTANELEARKRSDTMDMITNLLLGGAVLFSK